MVGSLQIEFKRAPVQWGCFYMVTLTCSTVQALISLVKLWDPHSTGQYLTVPVLELVVCLVFVIYDVIYITRQAQFFYFPRYLHFSLFYSFAYVVPNGYCVPGIDSDTAGSARCPRIYFIYILSFSENWEPILYILSFRENWGPI